MVVAVSVYSLQRPPDRLQQHPPRRDPASDRVTGVDQPQNALSPVRAGLFPGMAVCQKLVWDPPLPRTSATYWTMMQLAMSLGFFTAWPEL